MPVGFSMGRIKRTLPTRWGAFPWFIFGLLLLAALPSCRAPLTPDDDLSVLEEALQREPENWRTRMVFAEALLRSGEQQAPAERIDSAWKAANILKPPRGSVPPSSAILLRARAMIFAGDTLSALVLLEHSFERAEDLKAEILDALGELTLELIPLLTLAPPEEVNKTTGSQAGVNPGQNTRSQLADRGLEFAHKLHLISGRRAGWAAAFSVRVAELFQKGYDRRVAEFCSWIWSPELGDHEIGFYLGVAAMVLEPDEVEQRKIAAEALASFLSPEQSPEQPADPRIARHLRVARALTRRYHHESALEHVASALSVDPEDDDARALEILILLRMKRVEDADVATSDYVTRQPSLSRKLEVLQRIMPDLIAFRRTEKVLSEAYEIAARHPGAQLAALKLAASAVQTGPQQKKLQQEALAVARDLRGEEARLELVGILERAGDEETAQKILAPLCSSGGAPALLICLRFALAAGDSAKADGFALRFLSLPNAPAHALEMIGVLRRGGRGEIALDVVRAVLGKPGLPAEVYGDELSRLLEDDGAVDEEKVASLVEQYLHAYPQGDGALAVARIFAKAERFSDALHWFRQAVLATEAEEKARMIIETIRVSLKNEGSRGRYLTADLAEALRYAGDDPEILQQIASIASRSESNDPIRVEALERLVRGNHGNEKHILSLAALKLRMGFDDEAVPLFVRYVQRADTPSNAYQRVLQEFRMSGSPSALLRLFREAPEVVRSDPKLVQGTAVILERRGSRDVARRFYRSLLKLLAKDASARRRLGSQLMRRGYHDEALAFHVSVALEMPPGRYDLTVLRSAIKAGDLETARIHAERFVSASSRRPQAYEHVGNIFYGNLRYEDAYDFLKKAHGLAPRGRSAKLLERLMDVSLKIGKVDEVKQWIKLLVPNPDSRKAKEQHLHAAAEALAQLGHWEDAVYYLLRWARRRPGGTGRWIEVAALRISLGDDEAAVQTLALAWSKKKEEKRAAFLKKLRALLLRRERPDLLVRVAQRIAENRPGDGEILLLRGEGLLLLGKLEEGARAMLDALHAASEPEEAWQKSYELLSKLAPPELAITYVREAMALLPNEHDLAWALGSLYLILGDRVRAMDAYERFLGTSPSRAGRVAERLEKEGMRQEALPFYRVAASQITADSGGKVVEAYLSLARALRGDKGARQALAYILREKGAEPWVLKVCANALVEAGMIDDAQRLMKKLLVREGGPLEYRRLGILSYLKGDYAQMDEEMLSFVHHGGGHGGGPTQRGDGADPSIRRFLDVAEFLADEGHFDQALEWIVQARRRAPHRVEGWIAETWVSLRAGDLSRALSSMSRALKRDPIKALAAGKRILDLSIRLGEACAFYSLVHDLPEEIGVVGDLSLYPLAAACGQEDAAREAMERLIQEGHGAGRQGLAVLGQLAMDAGRYKDAVRVFQAQLARWSDLAGEISDARTPDPVVGLIRALGALQAEEQTDGRDMIAEEMRRVIRDTWQNASAPARVLNRLTEVLGPQLNRWDYAGELCDRLLKIDPARAELWLRRVDIALQRPHKDDIHEILRRLRDAAGPTRQALQHVRTVWLETGQAGSLGALRQILGLQATPATAVEAWMRFEESLSVLAFGEASTWLDLYLHMRGRSLAAHRRAIELLRDVGWYEEARRRIASALQIYPDDGRIQWYGYELDLMRVEGRDDAVDAIVALIARKGIAARDTADVPDSETLIRTLRGDELLRVAKAAGQRARWSSELRVLRAVGLARTGQKKKLRKEINTIDSEGLDVPVSLLLIAREVAAEGMEDVALEIFAKIRRWSGFLLGSRHLIRLLDDLVTTRKVADEKLRVVGMLGVTVTEEYLRVAEPGVAATTSLATFRNAAGQPEEATRTYEVLAERIPGEASTLNNLAYHNAVTGTQLHEGLILVNAALRMDPSGAPYYLDTRGWLFYRLGDLDRAARDLDASLRLTPLVRGGSSAEAHAHAAEIALERGDVDKACRHALRVRILEPLSDMATRAGQILGGIFEQPGD